jgi:hypothetical protein
MKTKRITQSNRLGSYLTATVGIGCLTGNSEAAIQIIDITPFAGPNGGISPGAKWRGDFVGVTNGLEIYNSNYQQWGLDGDNGVMFAVNSLAYAAIRNFSSGATIDGAATFADFIKHTGFRYEANPAAPDFGANSFVGFKANGKYGWLEVTWESSTDTFEILSGAYQDQVGVAIHAGDTGVSAIPEPASLLSTMGLLASGLLIRRRKLAA